MLSLRLRPEKRLPDNVSPSPPLSPLRRKGKDEGGLMAIFGDKFSDLNHM